MAAPGDERLPKGGILRAARRPTGWAPPGPTPPQPPDDQLASLLPGPQEDLCWLSGNWRILQRTDGHRFSLDDVTTAHFAAGTVLGADPCRLLDLGCGIGSVLLQLAWRFPQAQCVGVEAQSLSADLALRSIAWNGVADRVRVKRGDFRDPAALRGEAPFDLITGTPPYFPIGTGNESDEVQRGPCRFEHRGGVEAYCLAAAPHLAADAPLVLCESFGQRERVLAAARSAGLFVQQERDVIPKEGKAPLFSLFAMKRGAQTGLPTRQVPLTVRDRFGKRTAECLAMRAQMGIPP